MRANVGVFGRRVVAATGAARQAASGRGGDLRVLHNENYIKIEIFNSFQFVKAVLVAQPKFVLLSLGGIIKTGELH